MYSVVMMMAFSGGTEAADFGRPGRGCSSAACACSGCYGSSSSYGQSGRYAVSGFFGCSGYWYFGCSGGSPSGGYRVSGFFGCSGYWYFGCNGGRTWGGSESPPPRGERVSAPNLPPPQKTSSLDRATIVVTLPADAKLTIDGHPTTLSTETRRFVTPRLKVTSNYQCVLQAEIVRDGVRRIVTRTVPVRANEEIHVALDFTSAVAMKPVTNADH
jgi:uncharacterized protein (TIGR03000 family)